MIYMQLTEIIKSNDTTSKDLSMSKAVQEELRDLWSKGFFKIILKEEITNELSVLTDRYVVAVKS